ncbi:hypothetical protein [Hufsiella ginkgonis]|uniref:N-acetyltransferase domain-containing protein n=1 Tax=Hufsiella ginkgonis TaxID=2695274 RepID=A0A7K1XZ16_9SPHI|nr:hypothetical protein [Hufsiella ginkgonis]MXV16245.1 hypothetical protein [Hufsiella ginkgonis]
MKQVLRADLKKDLKHFIDFPHDLYKDDPNYVPELFIAQQDMLTPGKHPFHEHSTVDLFLAYDGGKVIGRVAAIMNNNHNKFNGTTDGFFGFFDCINDQETANMLLDAAKARIRELGATNMIGPASFSSNDVLGYLIEGFDRPPVAMMPYNAPYYNTLFENYGLSKKIDLLAYEITIGEQNDKAFRMLDLLETRLQRSGITIRKINLKNFKEEAAKLRELYNTAWDKNLGFVPMTPAEFDYLAKDLKMILDADYCQVAEKDGKFVGFGLAIPDINQILKTIKRGRLLPTGIFKLLLNKKKINGLRVLCLGVNEGYRKLGIEACIYGHFIKNSKKGNMKTAECSWMLETNYVMNHAIEQLNGRLYKKYRVLEQAI